MPIDVEVYDKPSAPQGPLKVSGVTVQSCVLSWLPPIDDGGSPIEKYIVEKMDTEKGDWQPVSFSI